MVDTNVLFEGVTKRGGAAGLLIEAWLAGLFSAFVSTALALEYVDVSSRKLSPHRWTTVQPLLGALLKKARWTPIHYSWRPASPDPSDDLVVDCAMNAAAILVTENRRDFRTPARELGLPVSSPVEFLEILASRNGGEHR